MRKPEDMTLRQKIGQMLATGFPGGEISGEFAGLVREYCIGNVILFRYNQQCRAQLTALCRDIAILVEGETGIPPFITSDEEGGVVSRLPGDMARMPSAMAQAAVGDEARVAEAARLTARQLRAVGINFNLAPVLDVNSNPANPVIGVRSYGTAADTVGRYAAAALEGYRRGGILTTGKHFPGHGDTADDSHLALPVIEKTPDELEAQELIPFRRAIAAGLPAVTVAHIMFPALEARRVPATMSRAIVTGLLREKLGFDGLVVSDCMEMDAVKAHYGVARGAVEAAAAGIDLIFVSHTPAQVTAAAEALRAAVEAGTLAEARIDGAVRRILRYKAQYIQPAPPLSQDELAATRDFARAFARDAIAKSRTGGRERFTPGQAPLFISPARSAVTRASGAADGTYSFAEAMRRRFGGEARVIDTDPGGEETAVLAAAARGRTGVVLGTLNADVHPGQLRLAAALAAAGPPMACVALRNPFELPLLPRGTFGLALYEYAPDTVELAMEFFS